MAQGVVQVGQQIADRLDQAWANVHGFRDVGWVDQTLAQHAQELGVHRVGGFRGPRLGHRLGCLRIGVVVGGVDGALQLDGQRGPLGSKAGFVPLAGLGALEVQLSGVPGFLVDGLRGSTAWVAQVGHLRHQLWQIEQQGDTTLHSGDGCLLSIEEAFGVRADHERFEDTVILLQDAFEGVQVAGAPAPSARWQSGDGGDAGAAELVAGGGLIGGLWLEVWRGLVAIALLELRGALAGLGSCGKRDVFLVAGEFTIGTQRLDGGCGRQFLDAKVVGQDVLQFAGVVLAG